MFIRLCVLALSSLLFVACAQRRPDAQSSGLPPGATAIDALKTVKTSGAAVQQVQERQESMIQSIQPYRFLLVCHH